MTPTKAALEALNNLVTPYDSNDELGLQMYGHYLHEHKDTIKQALTANTWQSPETVPKDGTWIILHLKKNRSGKQRTVREACYSPRLGRWNYYTCTDKDILGWQPLPEQPPC